MNSEQQSAVPQEAPVALTSQDASGAAPAFGLKRILVPVDFSPCSEKALAYAVPFARQFGAELTLLHVVQPYPPIAEMGPVDTDVVQEAKQDLEKLRAQVGIPPACSLLRVGDPDLEILDAAKTLGIDLIILSTHGRTGLGHLLLGSTTEKVVRHAPCPVLVVREHERDFIAPSK